MAQLATDQASDKVAGVSGGQVVEATKDLFTKVFGLQVKSEPDKGIPPRGDSLQATCIMSGSWNAELRVIAPYDLSEIVAAMMFDSDAGSVSEEETNDAVGELANVIAGNLKGQFSGDCELSIPEITDEPDDIPEGALCEVLWCGDALLHIVVVAR